MHGASNPTPHAGKRRGKEKAERERERERQTGTERKRSARRHPLLLLAISVVSHCAGVFLAPVLVDCGESLTENQLLRQEDRIPVFEIS